MNSPVRTRSLSPAAPALGLAAALLASACTLLPTGFEHERDAVDRSGEVYAAAPDARVVADLPANATWRDALERAFLVNGTLEAAYFEWLAAVERVPGAASWPNSALMPSFSTLLSGGATAWERTTIVAGVDAAENLDLPVKTRKAAEVALADAQAAGARFRTVRLALRRRVLDAWLDLALAEEHARVAQDDLELARLAASTAAVRVRAGGPQHALLQADIELRGAENRTLAAAAGAGAARARLNGLMARAPDAPVELAAELPEPRVVPSDAELLAVGLRGNPVLEELADRIAGREDALELARLMFLPNFNPFASFSGGAAEALGVAIMLPTTVPEIRAGIAAARAQLAETHALARQEHSDHAAHLLAALIMLRDSAREGDLFEAHVLPAARLLARTTERAYAAGAASLLELIEARRALLDVRLAIAEARVERERRVAELEEVAGFDMETLVAREVQP